MKKTLGKLALAASLSLYPASANQKTDTIQTSKEIKNDNFNKLKESFKESVNIQSFENTFKKTSDILGGPENLLKILNKISNNGKNFSEILKFFKANNYEEKNKMSDEDEGKNLYILTKESSNKNNLKNSEKKLGEKSYKIISEAQNQTLNEIKLLNVKNNGYEKLKEDLKDDINIQSFENTFKKTSDILGGPENLLKILDKISDNGENFSEVRKFFAANGYKTENDFFYTDEGKALYNLVKIFPENQRIFENYKTPFDNFLAELKAKGQLTSDYKKFLEKNGDKIEKADKINKFNKFKSFLFDHDLDGDIDSEKIKGVSEAQIFELTNIENFPYLLENLGFFENPENFEKNIFTEIELKRKFYKRLNLVLGTTHNAAPLFIEGGIEKFNKEYLKLEENFKEKIKEELSNEKIEAILKKKFPDNLHGLKEKLTDKDWDKISEQIRLEGVGASIGIVNGLGASFDIQKFTDGWLDSIQIGVAQIPDKNNPDKKILVPGISVSKKLFEAKMTENFGAHSNTGIGTMGVFINLGTNYVNTEDLKTAFQEEKEGGFFDNFETSLNVNYINLWGSLDATTVGINFSEMDEESFTGVEKMVQQMFPIMDNILDEIENGTKAKYLDVKKIFGNQDLTDKEISITKDKYQEIKDVYELMTKGLDKNQKLEIAEKLKRSAIQQYANKLHEKSEGFNFTGVGGGVVLLKNFLPVPYFMATGEYNYSEIKDVKDFFAEQASEKIISISNWKELGLETQKFGELYILKIGENYKGEKIYEGVNFSAEKNLGIEIEKEKNGEILISSKSNKIKNLKDLFKNIKTKYFYDHDGKSIKIIFGKGFQNENGEIIYGGGYDEKISRGLENKKDEIISDQIKMSDAVTEFEGIRDLVQNMSHKMDKKYEKRVYQITKNFRENPYNTANINSSWRKFLNSLEKNGSLKNFHNFKSQIQKITSQKQRQIILESIIHNVRSDQNLKWENDNKIHSTYASKELPIIRYDTMVQGGRDKSRSEAFSEQLSKDLGISKNLIDKYNKELYTNLKKGQSSFDVNYYTKGDIIGFIGTGKNKEIFPATNVVRYADINGDGNFKEGTDFLKMKNQKITPEIANLIPKNVLEKYVKKFDGHLEKNQKNINFIKKLISGEEKIKGIKVKYEIIFFKWGDCFNTTIGIKGLEININKTISGEGIKGGKIEVKNNVETYKQGDYSVGLSGIVTGDLEKDKKEEGGKSKTDNTDETTNPSTEDNINYTSESEEVNNNPNISDTIGDSINNGVAQETGTNPQSNINNPNTQATTPSNGDYGSESDF